MLSVEAGNKTSSKHVPDHLWSNDPKMAQIRLALLIHWIRTSVVFWTLIFLVALIFLGSGVVSTI